MQVRHFLPRYFSENENPGGDALWISGLVLAAPAPQLLFRGFGDSSLDFDLLVSVNQPELTLRIRSDLYYMLWKLFAEHDIEIPFPQRDLNWGNGWEKLATDLQEK